MSAQRELVSVVMPAWNAARWVEQAVTSLLVQTHRELEVLVVDDASTDATPDIVSGIRDSRVRVLRQASNGGVARALNAGLAAANGALIARLDADDYALPHRLERQVAFLSAHPDVGVVDAAAHLVDGDGRTLGVTPAYSGRALHWALHLSCPVIHPAVMMRRAVMPATGYPGVDTSMEDYALWLSILATTRIEHIAEPLIVYRRHPDAVGAKRGARLGGPGLWAALVGARLGMEVTAATARAWLRPRFVREADALEVARLAARLAPDRLDLGAHVPPWEPGALNRCRRVYASRLARLAWRKVVA